MGVIASVGLQYPIVSFQIQIPQTGVSTKVGVTSGQAAATTATGATVAGASINNSGNNLTAATSNSSITAAAGSSVAAGKSWSSVTSGSKNIGQLRICGMCGCLLHGIVSYWESVTHDFDQTLVFFCKKIVH